MYTNILAHSAECRGRSMERIFVACDFDSRVAHDIENELAQQEVELSMLSEERHKRIGARTVQDTEGEIAVREIVHAKMLSQISKAFLEHKRRGNTMPIIGVVIQGLPLKQHEHIDS